MILKKNKIKRHREYFFLLKNEKEILEDKTYNINQKYQMKGEGYEKEEYYCHYNIYVNYII